MWAARRLISLALALSLGAVFALPAAAQSTGGMLLPWEAKAAAQWLRDAVPEPAPGSETTVFALLRSQQVGRDDPYVTGYIDKLYAHVENGGVAEQKPPRTAWQLLALAAAGVDANTAAPQLVEALADGQALGAAGTNAVRLALLAFGPAEVAPPEGLDTDALADALADARNPDGGFGAEGISDAITTARAVQALAFYRQDVTAESGVADSREWLRDSQADYGGYDVDGSPSAQATAEVVTALCCLSEEGFAGFDDPVDALTVFQNEDGSFSADPDSEPDIELTALGLLALVSHARLERGMAPVYRMSDVPKQTAGGDTAADEGPALPGLAPLPTWAVVLILVGTVVLIVVMAALVGGAGRDLRRRHIRRKRAAKLRAARVTHPETTPSEKKPARPPVVALPVEYIGEEDKAEAKAPALPAAKEKAPPADPNWPPANPHYDDEG